MILVSSYVSIWQIPTSGKQATYKALTSSLLEVGCLSQFPGSKL